MNTIFQECTPKGYGMVPLSQASSFCDWYKNRHKTSAPKRLIVNQISVRSVFFFYFIEFCDDEDGTLWKGLGRLTS